MSEEGLVLRGVGGLYTVLLSDKTVECRGRGGLKRDRNILYVGDRVTVSPEGVITSILPRKNLLPRPPLANVDVLFAVVACADPMPNLYATDKLLALAAYCGVRPVLLFTKPDRGDPEPLSALYTSAGYTCYTVNALTGETCGVLRSEIDGGVCAFAGASGVGKSTLMNGLLPELFRRTGEISRKLQRGRHTTRAVELFPFAGGFLADTPGFSELDFALCGWKDRSVLERCFPEFAPYLSACAFRDCVHGKEKDCAVRRAVAEGRIAASRYENYLRMYEEIGPLRHWEERP